MAKRLSQLSRRQLLRNALTVLAASGAMPSLASIANLTSSNDSNRDILRLINWGDYLTKDVRKGYRAASGLSLAVDEYGSEPEFTAAFLSSHPPYDVVITSNDLVERLIRFDALRALDREQLGNLSHMEARFADAEFDEGRKYSVPYLWGTTAIGYRKSAFSSPPDSLELLLDSSKYSGRIALMADGYTNLRLALKYLGESLNTRDAKAIAEAAKLLARQKKHIKVFADDDGQDYLRSGEVDLVIEYNGDILQLAEESDDFAYVIPKEGAILWEDALCIPLRAAKSRSAHSFINYLYKPTVAARMAQELQYASPNKSALAEMDSAYRNNPAIFPPEAVLKKCEYVSYQGAEAERHFIDAWSSVIQTS